MVVLTGILHIPLFIGMFIIGIYYLQSLLIIFMKIKLCIVVILGIELIYICMGSFLCLGKSV